MPKKQNTLCQLPQGSAGGGKCMNVAPRKMTADGCCDHEYFNTYNDSGLLST
jgi:hypothetical protein